MGHNLPVFCRKGEKFQTLICQSSLLVIDKDIQGLNSVVLESFFYKFYSNLHKTLSGFGLSLKTKVPMSNSSKTKKHKNEEKKVLCPVDGCDKEVLSRGLHLHVMRSSGNGHGPHMDIPDNLNLEEAEEIGTQEVEMDYPEHREPEDVARLCPYCKRPYKGKHGVMIHLGQTAGRKNHPENPKEKHDPDDFAIVQVDENENVIEVVEEPTAMPSTERRREAAESGEKEGLDPEAVREHIESLREQGLDEQAEQAEKILLND